MTVEDCIAMSEDGDWYAFPGSLTRSQVIDAIAEGDWRAALNAFAFTRGHVFESAPGWWQDCGPDDACAVPAWIVRRK